METMDLVLVINHNTYTTLIQDDNIRGNYAGKRKYMRKLALLIQHFYRPRTALKNSLLRMEIP